MLVRHVLRSARSASRACVSSPVANGTSTKYSTHATCPKLSGAIGSLRNGPRKQVSSCEFRMSQLRPSREARPDIASRERSWGTDGPRPKRSEASARRGGGKPSQPRGDWLRFGSPLQWTCRSRSRKLARVACKAARNATESSDCGGLAVCNSSYMRTHVETSRKVVLLVYRTRAPVSACEITSKATARDRGLCEVTTHLRRQV